MWRCPQPKVRNIFYPGLLGLIDPAWVTQVNLHTNEVPDYHNFFVVKTQDQSMLSNFGAVMNLNYDRNCILSRFWTAKQMIRPHESLNFDPSAGRNHFKPTTWQNESYLDIEFRRTFLPSDIFLHPKKYFALKDLRQRESNFGHYLSGAR